MTDSRLPSQMLAAGGDYLLPLRTNQASNKRVLESDLCLDISNGDTSTISREVKRHQPLVQSSEHSPNSTSIISTSRSQTSVGRGLESHLTSSAESQPFTTDDEIHSSPGKTFTLRNIADDAAVSDIVFLLSPFSVEAPVVTFLSSGEALVEMEDPISAERAVQYINVHKPHVKSSPVVAVFSSIAEKTLAIDSDHSLSSKANTDSQSLRVLLVTITEIRHPVDIELLYRLFCHYGKIEKIVTFVKSSNRHQALIQFAETRQARDAAASLNNKCIFDGCNKIQVERHDRRLLRDSIKTIQIQSSKLSQLVVKQNNEKSWDFTVAPLLSKTHLDTGATSRVAYASLSAAAGSLIQSAAAYLSSSQAHPQLINPLPTQAQHSIQIPPSSSSVSFVAATHPFGSTSTTSATSLQVASPSPTSPHQQLIPPLLFDKLPRELQNPTTLHQLNPSLTSVVICYNLPSSEITVHKLFNLLSLYGVVLRIKLLREKPDTALAQYSHPLYATLACHYLTGAPFFGTDAGLQIGISKKTEVKLPPPGAKETTEEAKRTVAFQSQEQRAKAEEVEKFIRGACKPTNTLFIANIHESLNEETLRELLSTVGTVVKLEMRPPKQQSKRVTAMAEMLTEKEALSAICHLHNHQVIGCNLKLAFSKQILGSK